MTKFRLLITVFLAVALLAPVLAAQNTVVTKEKAVTPAAWINFVEGKVFFQDFEKVERDKAVNPGDEINTQNGRVEIELGEGNWIRLDHNTRVVFNDIQKNAATLSVWEGSLHFNLKSAAVTVRSAQEEHLFQDKGLVRIDVDKNGTQIFNNPRVADNFDGWSRSRDEEMAQNSSGEPYPYYRAPLFGGWAVSPFWPWSGYDWYMGFHSFWPYYDPFLWSYYAWPSWYFGWNPYWAWNSWYFGGFGYPYYGYSSGYGMRGGLYGRNVIRRDQIGRSRGMIGTEGRQLRQVRSGSSSLGVSTSGYPSRLARAIRPTSSATGYRNGSGSTRTVTSRSSSGRSSSGSSGRSYGGGSAGRSGGGGHGGGGRRR
jgi:hypothetical protein